MDSSRRPSRTTSTTAFSPTASARPSTARCSPSRIPYSYRHRERLTIPKFLINAAGDQFFLPDGSQFYFADMPPEKHLRYVPNAKHNLKGSDALESLQAFYQAVLDNHPRPNTPGRNDPTARSR